MGKNAMDKNGFIANGKLMSPKIDFAFKEIMNNEKVRKGFLSAVLKISPDKIKKTVLKNTNLPKYHFDEKQGILDVYLTMNDEKGKESEIDIEIQMSYMKAWADRSVFYLAKMITEQPNINKSYSNFKKCVGINILNFKYIKTENADRFHTVYHIREDTENIRYTDIMEWHIVELPKLPEIPPSKDEQALYDWVSFLQAETKEEFEMIAKKDEYLGEAYKQLEFISQDEEKRMEYTARQKALYDYNTLMSENYERGIEKGKAEERNSLAEKMRMQGYTEQQINALLSD